jgi:hypothetical protein
MSSRLNPAQRRGWWPSGPTGSPRWLLRLATRCGWLLLGLGGCKLDRKVQTSFDAGVADAGPPPKVELALRVTGALPDGGTVEADFEAGGGTAEVEAVGGLRVLANLPLSNYRIRLLDEADKVVASDDRAETVDEGLDYRIGLLAPLRPGRRYALVVDAQSGPMIMDTTGREHGELRLELLVSGEREPDRPVRLKAAPGGKSQRRRSR